MADTSSPKTEGNELEHLRDILYGERMRSIENRLDEIDQRISRNTTETDQRISQNTTELNRRVAHEVEELSKRLDAMGKRFDERVLALQNQEAADMNAIGKRLDAESTDQTAALKETREALQADVGNMADEIRAWREKIGQMVIALGNAWTDSESPK